MRNPLKPFALQTIAALVLAGVTGAPAHADTVAVSPTPAPIRHLVYTFDYHASTDVTQHDSGIGTNGGGLGNTQSSNSGTVDSKGALTDHGTITVDVVSVQADTGLLVRVSESSTKTRTTDPAPCVVYGNTTVVCDPNKTVNPEEMEVIRLLGRDFVSPASIDANNHWRIALNNATGSMTWDFTIGKVTGTTFEITSQRVTKATGAQAFTATADGKMTYDTARTLPTAIEEDETTRSDQGGGTYTTARAQTSFVLTTDSLAGSQ